MGMGYGNRVTVDIYKIGRKEKVGCLYDSEFEQDGAAHDIKRHREMNGWKELSFDLPVNVNGEHNWRADLMTNEYELRVQDGNDVDWYRLTEPTDTSDGIFAEHSVVCPHASVILKKRNIYLSFDDENGIGTLTELAARALDGTGWTLGQVDTFYEPDGVTEKVRTYNCNEKTGAYKMIQDMCNKFVAYPVFHGDTQTVDLLARANHVGMLEMRLDKNLTKLSRKRDSGDLVTRLYVEGEYGDLGYVGIDDVNPTGLSFLLNFDYYREIGALTAEQETAITTYLTNTASVRSSIKTLSAQNEANITSLQLKWGAQPYVLYVVNNGAYEDPIYGSGATSEDDAAVGDAVASVKADGSYTYRELSSLTPAPNEAWMVKFVTPVAGTLGGKEVAIEAKQKTIATLQAEIDKPSTTETMKESLQEQIAATNADIATLTSESTVLMLECITLALSIHTAEGQLATYNTQLLTIEEDFNAAMGDMLQDGYFSDDTYAPGQEEALYNDSVELLKQLSKPQLTYTFNEIDLVNTPGYSDELFTMDIAVHLMDDTLGVNDYGFVSETDEYLDKANTRSCKVQTDELNIQGKSFASYMGRVTDAAQVIKDEQSVFERARAISAEGTFGADKLNGIIDVLQNQLMSSVSNWYTDENGNLMFIAADESSAMMLSGSGFMVADGKTNGNWNWRSFGTGKGFTADLMTAGVLRAGLITILGSDQFYWTGDNLYVIDPENDLNQIRIGKYDGVHLGIGYTRDGGITWQNAIGFDGIHLSASDQEILDNAGIGGRNYIRHSQSLTDLTTGTLDLTMRTDYGVVGLNTLG